MTIDEAIAHALEMAGEQQERADSAELIDILDGLDVEACKECATEYRQLAEWLTELKEAKRLLKAAVDDMNSNNFCHKFDSCKVCLKQCNISCNKKFQWHYTDEALKLIGDEPNGI